MKCRLMAMDSKFKQPAKELREIEFIIPVSMNVRLRTLNIIFFPHWHFKKN